MTRLLEHQVKDIIRSGGITVPRARLCASPEQAAEAAQELDGPVYVKAQVAAGDRAAAGGVRRADDARAAAAAAKEILEGGIHGIAVEKVLVEEAVQGAWEGYASVSIVEGPARRVLRFSPKGGAGYDPANAPVVLELTDALHPYRIRKALREEGVASEELVPITSFLHRLATLADRWAAYTLEVNPITLTPSGVVALDAKADLDDYSKALIPEPGLLEIVESDPRERKAREYQANDHRGSLRYVQLIPESAPPGPTMVATHSVGGGESMVVLDALSSVGLQPTNYCDTSGSPSADKVAVAAELVTSQRHIAGLFFSTCIANQRLSITAEGLVRGWRNVGWQGPTVVRFAGNEGDQAREIVREWARETGAPHVVLDENANEWSAAEAMVELLKREGAK